MYFSRVFATTSGGSSGAGGFLSQPFDSSQSRTNCRVARGADQVGLTRSHFSTSTPFTSNHTVSDSAARNIGRRRRSDA